MGKSIKVTKLDAAKRQLETAIRLYFFNQDPVSIHTLSAAAYNIVKDINAKSKGKSMIVKELFMEYIKPEYEKLMINRINEAENFFKHANKDSDASFDFDPEQTDIFIMDACTKYYALTGEFSPLFKIFLTWFLANNQKLYNLTEEEKKKVEACKPYILSWGKERYFKEMLPAIMKIGT